MQVVFCWKNCKIHLVLAEGFIYNENKHRECAVHAKKGVGSTWGL